jgi:hypothetical protein
LHPVYIIKPVSHPAHFNPEDGNSMFLLDGSSLSQSRRAV